MMSRSVLGEFGAVLAACALMWVLSLSGCVPVQNQPAAVDAAASRVAAGTSIVVPVGATVPPVEAAAVVDAADVVEVADVVDVDAADVVEVSDNASVAITQAKPKAEPHPRAGQYKQALRQQAQHVWGLNAPVASFAAQIHQESRWNPKAKSPVGAAGLTQFMPATARWIGTYDGQLASVDVYNPRWAMRALAVYDKFLYDKVAGTNPCERMAFAMSAYNGGLGWVNKRKARSSAPLVCFGATCEINPGITAANQRENAGYPKVILKGFEAQYVKAGWGRGVCHERGL
ncbi:MAG: lytic transglycosylase domain-containing protein [Formosimonas sp.]|jgi:soluble lytic murein transglycosylase-like protein